MCGAILKATKSSFQRGMTFCICIYMKKVMKLLAFIFEQPSYIRDKVNFISTNRNIQIVAKYHIDCRFEVRYLIIYILCSKYLKEHNILCHLSLIVRPLARAS